MPLVIGGIELLLQEELALGSTGAPDRNRYVFCPVAPCSVLLACYLCYCCAGGIG